MDLEVIINLEVVGKVNTVMLLSKTLFVLLDIQMYEE